MEIRENVVLLRGRNMARGDAHRTDIPLNPLASD